MSIADLNSLAGTKPLITADNKGSLSNRVGYATKQALNLQKTRLKDTFTATAGIATSVGAAAAVAKSKTLQGIIGNVFTKSKNIIKYSLEGTTLKETAKKALPYLQKAGNWVKTLPGPAKAVLGAGVLLTGIVCNNIKNKGIYEAGKIDQQYTDKAKLEEQFKKYDI